MIEDSSNYYILLGLDSAEDDWAVIERKIESCRGKWSTDSTRGASAKQDKAKRQLELIPDMRKRLRDPEERRKIAQEAVHERKAHEEQQLEKLDALIKLIRGTTIGREEVKDLIKAVGGGLGESTIQERLRKRGISVASGKSGNSSGRTRAPRPKLDSTTARSIQRLLKQIGKETLYDFLGQNWRCSPKVLCEVAHNIYSEEIRKGKTDSTATTRKELAGQCKAVFKDEQQKERYDNSHADLVVEQSFKDMLDFAGRDKLLERSELEVLMNEARSKGVSPDIVREYIEEYAEKRKWRVEWHIQDSGGSLPAERKLCGLCDTVARTPTDTRCHNCGENLVQPCPICRAQTPTQDECCGKCGCRTGDRPYVHGLLRDGQNHFKNGDLSLANSCFDKALACWQDWQPAKAEQRYVRDTEDKLKVIKNLVQNRNLEQALDVLEQLRECNRRTSVRIDDWDEVKKLKNSIDVSWKKANNLCSAAKELQQRGKGMEALNKYSEALFNCTDFKPALRALEATPPPVPPVNDLRVSRKAGTVLLEWTPPGSGQGEVRIMQVRKQVRDSCDASPGRIIPLSCTDRFGELMPASSRGKAQAVIHEQGRVIFVPLTVIRQVAVLGRSASVTILDEVTSIKTRRGENDTIYLSWTWPVGAASALVVWRCDTYPAGPKDTEARRQLVEKRENDREGLYELRAAGSACHYFAIFVRDRYSDHYSTGVRAIEAGGMEARVTYRVVKKHRLLRKTITKAWIELQTKDKNVKVLSGIQAVLKESSLPIRPADGHVIVSGSRLEFQRGRAKMELPVNGLTGFVKLFFKNDKKARKIRLLPAGKENLRL